MNKKIVKNIFAFRVSFNQCDNNYGLKQSVNCGKMEIALPFSLIQMIMIKNMAKCRIQQINSFA